MDCGQCPPRGVILCLERPFDEKAKKTEGRFVFFMIAKNGLDSGTSRQICLLVKSEFECGQSSYAVKMPLMEAIGKSRNIKG